MPFHKSRAKDKNPFYFHVTRFGRLERTFSLSTFSFFSIIPIGSVAYTRSSFSSRLCASILRVSSVNFAEDVEDFPLFPTIADTI